VTIYIAELSLNELFVGIFKDANSPAARPSASFVGWKLKKNQIERPSIATTDSNRVHFQTYSGGTSLQIGLEEAYLQGTGYPASIPPFLRAVSARIEALEYEDMVITDLIYHDHSDTDGHQDPLLRFYYIRKGALESTFR
jgi:hypothetical protein